MIENLNFLCICLRETAENIEETVELSNFLAIQKETKMFCYMMNDTEYVCLTNLLLIVSIIFRTNI